MFKSEEEIREDIEGKSKEEIRDYIIEELVYICDEAERLLVEEENYETASELLKSKKRIQKL
jgi:hypothetical protein